MTVYVVISSGSESSGDIIGVFSSKEKAQEQMNCMEEHRDDHPYVDWYYDSFELDRNYYT